MWWEPLQLHLAELGLIPGFPILKNEVVPQKLF